MDFIEPLLYIVLAKTHESMFSGILNLRQKLSIVNFEKILKFKLKSQPERGDTIFQIGYIVFVVWFFQLGIHFADSPDIALV